jgi:hypothetical protein
VGRRLSTGKPVTKKFRDSPLSSLRPAGNLLRGAYDVGQPEPIADEQIFDFHREVSGLGCVLLDNYVASSLVTASDGHSGMTLPSDVQLGSQSVLANPHH